MIEPINFYYYCTIERQVLANREQEYLRRKSDECDSEFEDMDFQDAKRWIKDVTISFAEKKLPDLAKRISREYNNPLSVRECISEDGLIYYFESNCLIENQRLLHRDKIYISYQADVEISSEDISNILEKDGEPIA